MFEVIKVTDVGGEDVDDILLIDDRGAQDESNSGGSVGFVFSFGDNIIDFPGSKGRKERREGDNEARRVESVLLELAIEEDGTSKSQLFFREVRVAEGEDQDPLLGGDREGR